MTLDMGKSRSFDSGQPAHPAKSRLDAFFGLALAKDDSSSYLHRGYWAEKFGRRDWPGGRMAYPSARTSTNRFSASTRHADRDGSVLRWLQSSGRSNQMSSTKVIICGYLFLEMGRA